MGGHHTFSCIQPLFLCPNQIVPLTDKIYLQGCSDQMTLIFLFFWVVASGIPLECLSKLGRKDFLGVLIMSGCIPFQLVHSCLLLGILGPLSVWVQFLGILLCLQNALGSSTEMKPAGTTLRYSEPRGFYNQKKKKSWLLSSLTEAKVSHYLWVGVLSRQTLTLGS